MEPDPVVSFIEILIDKIDEATTKRLTEPDRTKFVTIKEMEEIIYEEKHEKIHGDLKGAMHGAMKWKDNTPMLSVERLNSDEIRIYRQLGYEVWQNQQWFTPTILAWHPVTQEMIHEHFSYACNVCRKGKPPNEKCHYQYTKML